MVSFMGGWVIEEDTNYGSRGELMASHGGHVGIAEASKT